MSATIIQAAVRSMLLRCWLKIWIKKRAHFIIVCQAHLRRRIAYRRWAEIRKIEYHSARCIQCLIRKFLAKCEALLLRQVRAINMILSCYHDYKALKHHKKKHKNMYAIKIQTFIRVHISKRIFEKVKNEKVGAAKHIQRSWRGYLARKLSSNLLHERYINSCQSRIKIFSSDVDYYNSLLKSLERSNVDNRNNLFEEMTEFESSIRRNEVKLEELQKSLAKLTPKSVHQGWKEQLENDFKLERTMLTKQKVHFMFKIQKKVLEREMRVERDSKLKNFCREMVDSSLQWKSDLTSQLYEESQENQKVEKDRRQREAIAKEKRKWTLAHSKVSGKSLIQCRINPKN